MDQPPNLSDDGIETVVTLANVVAIETPSKLNKHMLRRQYHDKLLRMCREYWLHYVDDLKPYLSACRQRSHYIKHMF